MPSFWDMASRLASCHSLVFDRRDPLEIQIRCFQAGREREDEMRKACTSCLISHTIASSTSPLGAIQGICRGQGFEEAMLSRYGFYSAGLSVVPSPSHGILVS